MLVNDALFSPTFFQSALDVDPVTGSVAYLAGSVVVILDADGCQRHIVNETKKAFTSLAFSVDGKTLLTGVVSLNVGSFH